MEHMEDILNPHHDRESSTTINWLQGLEKSGTAIWILLLDFQKAFDRVDHPILLTKVNCQH